MVIGVRRLGAQTGHAAGRQLLQELYQAHYGADMPDILVTERGKPYFASGAPWFSITHTKRHVFCVLSDRPVGIDAEELDRRIKPGLAEKILSSGELAQYRQAEDPRRALLTFWVLKEALVKYTGEGLRGYPRATDFSLADPRVRQVSGCLVAVIGEDTEILVQETDYVI